MSEDYDRPLALAHTHATQYLREIENSPVYPRPDAIAALEAFDEPLPLHGSADQETLDLLHGKGSAATVASMGSRYFGFVVGGALPVTVGANWIATAWDQTPSSFISSPTCVKLEEIAGRWLRELLALPEHTGVGMTTGATMANFTALAAARHALLARAGWNVEEQGLYGAPEIKVIVSDEVHVTVEKALSMLGFGKKRVTRVPTDDNGAMRFDGVPGLDDMTLICTQAGNVNSGAIDPIGAIARKAAGAGAWVHVDGAFGLWGRLLARREADFQDVELADSVVVDAHKWLNTPYDCGIVMTRHAEALQGAMGTVAPYLKEEKKGEPKDMGPEFSRRARGVEVWAALRSLGHAGLKSMIGRCCDHAQVFADGLRAQGFEILNDVVLNQVVATIGTPEQIAEIRRLVEVSGECWFGSTFWKGWDAVRISVSSWRTTEEDVERSLAAIAEARRQVMGD
ncbi:MAG: aspartate aminotransferase family protein [Alphaproteobacteria bacterium]|nr:aspartate aminotransferase family protein [Alphaproteobacteria bacterium]